MSKTYYLSSGSNKIGPLSSHDILGFLKAGRISYFDMIFNQQINEWVMLMQHPDFADQGEEERESFTDGNIAVGLLSEGDFSAKELTGFGADSSMPALDSVSWYLQGNPNAYSFLQILEFVKQNHLAEHSLIAKQPQGPWRPLSQWEEFSKEALGDFSESLDEDVPSIRLRRSNRRVPVKKYFLVFFNGQAVKEFCLEISTTGLSFFCQTERFRVNDALTIKFDSEFDEVFDAQGVVVSQRRVRVANQSQSFVRYGVRFTKLSHKGRDFIERQLTGGPRA
ncbi:PilZ domain protein [compost metagenome]